MTSIILILYAHTQTHARTQTATTTHTAIDTEIYTAHTKETDTQAERQTGRKQALLIVQLHWC